MYDYPDMADLAQRHYERIEKVIIGECEVCGYEISDDETCYRFGGDDVCETCVSEYIQRFRKEIS